jgi:CubicO group peptidase (beta-lactamase class C family)
MRAAPFTRPLAAAGLIAGLALVPTTPRPVWADDPGSGKFGSVRSRMQAFVDQGEIAGAVTVVGRKDGVLSLEAVGYQDLDAKRPMPKDALFRIASMTKPVTAIGVMILAEEGKLAIEDPVEKYLPEFKGQMLVASRTPDTVTLKKPPRPIFIRDLLTHTSGMPGSPPPGLSALYQKRNISLAEGVMAFSQRPLDFEPGSKWAYCNTGIDTLGRVIEVASGQSYEDFLRQRVFEPLGMTDTTFYLTKEQRPRLATLYGKKDGKLVPDANALIGVAPANRYPIPAGGLCSTGQDLARLYRMMLSGGTLDGKRILSPETVAAMTKVQTGDLKTGFTPGNGWGLGWCVVREPQGVTEALSPGTYGHGGAFGTQAWLDPQKDLFMVLLIQRTGLQNSDGTPMRKDFQAAAVEALKR